MSFRDSTFSVDSVGLKCESTFKGRAALLLHGVMLERSGLLLSGGVDARLENVKFQSCKMRLVSNCTASLSRVEVFFSCCYFFVSEKKKPLKKGGSETDAEAERQARRGRAATRRGMCNHSSRRDREISVDTKRRMCGRGRVFSLVHARVSQVQVLHQSVHRN
jgi:hypothetical protein